MKNLFVLLTILFLISGWAGQKTNEQKTLKGKLYSSGNEPFTELALQTAPYNPYIIDKSSKDYSKLSSLQGEQIKVIKYNLIEKSNRIVIKQFLLIKLK